MKKFCIIGLGRFGYYLVKELKEKNFDLIVIDLNIKKLDDIIEIADESLSFDTTNKIDWENSDIDIESIDAFIVSLGESFEKNIYTTMILSELGAKNIYTRASSLFEERIINKLNQSTPQTNISVFMPERLAAQKWSQNFLLYKTKDVSAKLHDNFYIIKYIVKNSTTSILDSKIRKKFNINIVLIERENQAIIPTPNSIIQPNDTLSLAGEYTDIQKFLRENF